MTTTAIDTQNARNLVIPVDFAASGAAGAVTYWRLSGSIPHADLAAAWAAAGLPEAELPRLPSPETVLRRTVTALREARRHVDPLARRGAWAVVDVRPTADDLDFRTTAKVFYVPETADAAGNVTPAELRVETDDDKLADTIRATYAEQAGLLTSTDISAWLIRRVEALQAVSLRDSGGVYFVPKGGVAYWRLIAGVLAETTRHTVFQIPALPNQDAAAAILDAIMDEVTTAVARIDAELTAEPEDRIGPRALRARTATCHELASKVGVYEDLLGRSLADLRTQLDELEARVVAASLLAQASEQAE